MLLKVTGCLLIHIRLTIITIPTGFWLRFCCEDYNHSKFRKPAIRTTVNRRTSDRGPKKNTVFALFRRIIIVRIAGFALRLRFCATRSVTLNPWNLFWPSPPRFWDALFHVIFYVILYILQSVH